MREIFKSLKSGLIVSCQAEGDSPFNNAQDMAKYAILAQQGGAIGIRTQGLEKIEAIKQAVNLPLVGLTKDYFEDGFVKITGSYKEVEEVLAHGADIVAIDGTFRRREGLTGPEFIQDLKHKNPEMVIMADIATLEEAVACYEAGADCVSTTLNGYTPETVQQKSAYPNMEILTSIIDSLGEKLPVIAEGRFNTPEMASEAIKKGAWCVVVGTAITRPHLITKWFTDAIEQ